MEYFVSCDWGTSNFRLRLVKADSLEVIKEFRSNQGIKTLYNQIQDQNLLERKGFFENYLLEQVNLLSPNYKDYLIIVSGMASSNIGLIEMDYALFPFSGNDLNSKLIKLKNGLQVLMISGVKNEFGMMRGEETQAVGLEDYLHPFKDSVLLLPGTHSKHLTYHKHSFIELKNYMTGELFEILSQKSILANSIRKEDKDNISKMEFLQGVKLGCEGQLSSSLFSIRANEIFKKSTKEDNYFFLSGLIIGDELAYLKGETRKVFLAAPYPLANLYKLALDHILGSNKYIVFDRATVEKSVLIGQKKILESYDK